MALGLRQGTVRVVAYDASWPDAGASHCATVRDAAAPVLVDVQHVGSTAVPGLAAKPIIDLAAAVAALDAVGALVAPLAAAGYAYRGDALHPGDHLFVRDLEPGVRLVHLHVVAQGSAAWRDYLRFRDALRADPVARQSYGALKLALAAQYPTDREAYTAAKTAAIQALLTRQG